MLDGFLPGFFAKMQNIVEVLVESFTKQLANLLLKFHQVVHFFWYHGIEFTTKSPSIQAGTIIVALLFVNPFDPSRQISRETSARSASRTCLQPRFSPKSTALRKRGEG